MAKPCPLIQLTSMCLWETPRFGTRKRTSRTPSLSVGFLAFQTAHDAPLVMQYKLHCSAVPKVISDLCDLPSLAEHPGSPASYTASPVEGTRMSCLLLL